MPRRSLLISMGSSWAVVPEAFHARQPGADGYASVQVLTSSSKDVEQAIQNVRDWFTTRHPDVELGINRVTGFIDLQARDEHELFEETLLRWMLACERDPRARAICLAGGFKTMSTAMQRAATVLGAAEVFHVLASKRYKDGSGRLREPSTPAEVDDCIANNQITYIYLDEEPGWPQLFSVRPEEYPLERVDKDAWTELKPPDQSLRSRVKEVAERRRNIESHWDRIAELPFLSLATWPLAALDWLQGELAEGDRKWIDSLPKVELHCHFGGFATHGDDLRRVRAAAQHRENLPALDEPVLPASWPEPTTTVDLERYIALGNANGTILLKDPGCLREQVRLLYRHLRSENVVYAEIRCSPANYGTSERSPWQVVNDIRAAFAKEMAQAAEATRVNLILIATRRKHGDYRASIARHLALAVAAAEHNPGDLAACRVVGVDLAGFEDPTTRADLFQTDFEAVHRVGLAVTVHAGEVDTAEAIWQAVFRLNARRIGHGLSLQGSPELRSSIADRGIGVELCPYANYQIRGFQPMPGETGPRGTYPVLDYLQERVRVSVNTDNIGISQASLSDNLFFLRKLNPSIRRLDILRLIRNAADTAFLPAAMRADLVRRIDAAIPQPTR